MKIRSPYTEILTQWKNQQIVKSFPILKTAPCKNYISIYKYTSHVPECFYSKEIYTLFLDWLNTIALTYQSELQFYFSDNEKRISNAIRNINQINELKIHDENLQGKDDYNLLEVIDGCIHPNYLRLIEAVYAPLVHIIAYFSRIIRNVSTDKLDVFNSVEEIQKQYPNLEVLTKPYQHNIRNGIAHGAVEYLNNEIKYTDKKGNGETFYYADVISVFDELLDCCNAMVLALKVFLAMQKGYKFPLAFLIDELKAQTDNKWIEVNNCISTTIQSDVSQLIIYSFVKTTDINKVNYFMLQTANLAESLMPGYGRYFITFRSKCAYPGWYSFNGDKLAAARLSQAEDYKPFVDAIDESGVLFKSKITYPQIFYKMDSFLESFVIQAKTRKNEVKKLFNKLDMSISNYEIHKNGLHSVINADITLNTQDGMDVNEYMKKHCQIIVRQVFNQRKRRVKHNCIMIFLPLGFVRISVYSRLMRKRTYNSYGLGKDLICVIKYKGLSRIRCPSIFGSEIENHGLYSIEWNKNWLENNNA